MLQSNTVSKFKGISTGAYREARTTEMRKRAGKNIAVGHFSAATIPHIHALAMNQTQDMTCTQPEMRYICWTGVTKTCRRGHEHFFPLSFRQALPRLSRDSSWQQRWQSKKTAWSGWLISLCNTAAHCSRMWRHPFRSQNCASDGKGLVVQVRHVFASRVESGQARSRTLFRMPQEGCQCKHRRPFRYSITRCDRFWTDEFGCAAGITSSSRSFSHPRKPSVWHLFSARYIL